METWHAMRDHLAEATCWCEPRRIQHVLKSGEEVVVWIHVGPMQEASLEAIEDAFCDTEDE